MLEIFGTKPYDSSGLYCRMTHTWVCWDHLLAGSMSNQSPSPRSWWCIRSCSDPSSPRRTASSLCWGTSTQSSSDDSQTRTESCVRRSPSVWARPLRRRQTTPSCLGRRPGGNCIKIGLPVKSILRDFSREYDFQKTFSLTVNKFSRKTYFYTIHPWPRLFT